MNFLELLNLLAREARPAFRDLSPITEMDTPFSETEIDSLDGLMIMMYFAIIYDIADDVAEGYHPETPQKLLEFVEQYKKRDPESLEAAMEMVK